MGLVCRIFYVDVEDDNEDLFRRRSIKMKSMFLGMVRMSVEMLQRSVVNWLLMKGGMVRGFLRSQK